VNWEKGNMKNMYFFDEKSFFWDWNARKKGLEIKILSDLFRCLPKNHLLCSQSKNEHKLKITIQ
jgi:hypothetical protein